MTERSNEVTEAVSALVTHQPFFASLLYDQLKVVERDDIETAATDGKHIYVGPWFRKLPIGQRLFVLCHEIMHFVLSHLKRAKLYKDRGFGPDLKEFDFQKWNAAGDYYINYMLSTELVTKNSKGHIKKIGTMPPDGLLDTNICGSLDTLVDDIYLSLPEDDRENWDEHEMPGDGDEVASEADVKQAIATARNAAKALGKMPAGLERVVGDLLTPKQKWSEILKDEVTATVGTEDTSWSSPNRRRLALPPHVPFPGSEGYEMGTMVVAIDTSGSISNEELAAFLGEMGGIIEQVKPRELWVAWWDTKAILEPVEDIDELARMNAYGGGGTDYHCVAPKIEDEYIDPEIVVCMTDGYVSWPQEFPWPQITVTTGDESCPFGRQIKMDISKDYV